MRHPRRSPMAWHPAVVRSGGIVAGRGGRGSWTFGASACRRARRRVARAPRYKKRAGRGRAARGSSTQEALRVRCASHSTPSRRVKACAVEQEQAGSLETARKLTELGRIPDVHRGSRTTKCFPQVADAPPHVTWYAQFARNRMVLRVHRPLRASPPRSRRTTGGRSCSGPGVEVGHSNPEPRNPAGYRALARLPSFAEFALPPSRGLACTAFVRACRRRTCGPSPPTSSALVQGARSWTTCGNTSRWRQAAGLRYFTASRGDRPRKPCRFGGLRRRQRCVWVRAARRTTPITMRGHTDRVWALDTKSGLRHPALAERFVAFLFVSGRAAAPAPRQHLDAARGNPRFVGASGASRQSSAGRDGGVRSRSESIGNPTWPAHSMGKYTHPRRRATS